MKTLYMYAMSLSLTCLGLFAQSTPGTSVYLSNTNPCKGDVVTAKAYGLSTTISAPDGTNQQNGFMFDIEAAEDIDIRNFSVYFNTVVDSVYIYYKPGSHVGFESSAAAWTLLDIVPGSTNIGTLHDLEANFNVFLSQGQTASFYITSNVSTQFIHYDNGTSVGNTVVSNTDLTIKTGVGKAYPFSTTFQNRNFRGVVHYGNLASSPNWNVSGTAQGDSITFTAEESKVITGEFTENSLNTLS